MADGEVTLEGTRFIKSWLDAQQSVASANRHLTEAQIDLREAEQNLAKWMLPPDTKPGEKIAVWFGDSLIQVEAGKPHERIKCGGPQDDPEPDNSIPHKVTVRSRGKHFERLR